MCTCDLAAEIILCLCPLSQSRFNQQHLFYATLPVYQNLSFHSCLPQFAQHKGTRKLHCSTLTLIGLDELHGKTVKSWNWGLVMLAACSSRLHAGCSGFLSPFLPSVLDLFVAVALVRGAGIRTGVSLSVAARCSWPVGVGELQSRNFPMRISKIIQCRMGGGLCLSEKWSRNESAKM